MLLSCCMAAPPYPPKNYSITTAHVQFKFSATAFHGPSVAMWRRHFDHLHGHSAWLWPVASARDAKPRLVQRNLCLCHCHSEPDLGRGGHFCRDDCRPFWCVSGHHRGGMSVRTWASGYVASHHTHGADPKHRRDDWLGPSWHHFCCDLRNYWPQCVGGQTLVGHGRCGCGGVFWTVFHGAGRGLFNQPLRLARSPLGSGRLHFVGFAFGLSAARAWFFRRASPQARPKHCASRARSLGLPQLFVADGRLLCVRLSGGVYWRAHAQLFKRQRLVS